MKNIFLVFLVGFSVDHVSAHGGKAHKSDINKNTFEVIDSDSKLKLISHSYLKTIKPIFQKKCFNCHSSSTKYPWYHIVPGIKKVIDDDIKVARKHMDMSVDFPFQGHGNPKDDLIALSKSLIEDSMPAFRYWIMNINSSLTEEEKKLMHKWIMDSEDLLGIKIVDSKPLVLNISGMTCPSCAASVESHLGKLPEIKSLSINLGKGLATLTLKEGMSVRTDVIIKAVQDAGFKVTSIQK